jgi:hypothetical protein
MEGMQGRERKAMCLALFAAATVYLFLASGLGLNLLEHSAFDSYTLAAMRWREGHIALGQDYPWLELAIFEGDYYVSFPPFPTLPMWLLTFFFGGDTPSMLVNFVWFLLSTATVFKTARALEKGPEEAAAWAVGVTCGCNLLEVSLYGGVWNMAQGLSFFLTLLCAYGMTVMRGRKIWRAIAPVAIACAVGCRPFQAVYVPATLLALYSAVREEEGNARKRLTRCIPYLIVPGLIAVAYGVFNYVRFGQIFEFGHNYLPEFVRAEDGQFSLAYVGKNVANILRLPEIDAEGRLNFPHAFGFAFYIANPLYVIAAIRLVQALWRRIRRRERGVLDGLDACLLAGAAVHFFLLLLHKSFGGWQFGTRYLIDLLPMLGLFAMRRKTPLRLVEGTLLIFAVCFNAYGAIVFHLT